VKRGGLAVLHHCPVFEEARKTAVFLWGGLSIALVVAPARSTSPNTDKSLKRFKSVEAIHGYTTGTTRPTGCGNALRRLRDALNHGDAALSRRTPSAPLIANPARGRAGGTHLLKSGLRLGREQFQVVSLQ
jgi:hypothetical protein